MLAFRENEVALQGVFDYYLPTSSEDQPQQPATVFGLVTG